MDIVQMEYFVRVAESTTMLQAAESLNVSQSTLSMSIKKLEAELGTKLFRREGHHLRLTDAGERFHEGANHILVETAALKQRILSAGDTRAKTVVVASDAVDYATESVYFYAHLNPSVTIQHIRAKHSAMRNMLLIRQVDFCLSIQPLMDRDIESTLLLSEPMYLLANVHSPFAAMSSVSIRDLENEPLISLPKGHAFRDLCETYYSMIGMKPKSVIEVGELEALAMSVQKCFGITFIPRSVQGRKNFHSGTHNIVCARPIQESFCYRNVYLSHLKTTTFSPQQTDYLAALQKYNSMVKDLRRLPELEEYCAEYL